MILLGLGLDEFSISPVNMLEVKRIIRAVSYEDAKKIAEKALTLSTGIEIEKLAREKLKDVALDIAMNL